jgi:hypothetical protein
MFCRQWGHSNSPLDLYSFSVPLQVPCATHQPLRRVPTTTRTEQRPPFRKSTGLTRHQRRHTSAAIMGPTACPGINLRAKRICLPKCNDGNDQEHHCYVQASPQNRNIIQPWCSHGHAPSPHEPHVPRHGPLLGLETGSGIDGGRLSK